MQKIRKVNRFLLPFNVSSWRDVPGIISRSCSSFNLSEQFWVLRRAVTKIMWHPTSFTHAGRPTHTIDMPVSRGTPSYTTYYRFVLSSWTSCTMKETCIKEFLLAKMTSTAAIFFRSVMIPDARVHRNLPYSFYALCTFEQAQRLTATIQFEFKACDNLLEILRLPFFVKENSSS